MKIAICNCERVIGKCSSMGCFRAYNNKSKHFERYKDEEVELAAFFYCDICSSRNEENLEKIAQRLKDKGVSQVHIGACALKCPAGKLEQIKEIFWSKDLEIIEGTH